LIIFELGFTVYLMIIQMKRTLILLLTLLSCSLQSQTTNGKNGVKALKGRVVTTQETNQKGVGGVTVSIKDFDYDITNNEGYFELNVPVNQDFVTVIVENTAMQMLKPDAGLVHLPQVQQVELVLCGAQNTKLLQEAKQLKSKVSKLEKSHQLTSRQLSALYNQMMDTIIYYQDLVGGLQGQLNQSTQLNTAQTNRILALEDSVKILKNALFDALQSRFMHQKAVHDQVSTQLNLYLDKLKDLRDRSTSDRLSLYFLNNEAGAELTKTITNYNAAREEILKNKEKQINDSKAFWDNPQVAIELESTFKYLFEKVHNPNILPLDKRVFEQMRLYATGQKGRMKAEKEAKKASNEIIPSLDKVIVILEQHIKNTITVISKNI
jgi:hypothetical protein